MKFRRRRFRRRSAPRPRLSGESPRLAPSSSGESLRFSFPLLVDLLYPLHVPSSVPVRTKKTPLQAAERLKNLGFRRPARRLRPPQPGPARRARARVTWRRVCQCRKSLRICSGEGGLEISMHMSGQLGRMAGSESGDGESKAFRFQVSIFCWAECGRGGLLGTGQ